MKEYVGMLAAQVAQVLLIIVSKFAIADGMSNYSFIFYSNFIASLILLPLSLIFHRSITPINLHQQIVSSVVNSIAFVIVADRLIVLRLALSSSVDFSDWPSRIFGYSGISLSSATLATTLLNLIPGFTFILAILCRMEAVNIRSSSTQAKFIGTVVSIAGAIIITLYKGPPILSSPKITNNLLVQPSNWVLGGIFLAIDCVFSSMYIIAQAIVLKKYPAVMIVMFSYCLVCTILSALVSLIVENDLSSFNLHPKKRLFSILYSGIFGSAFQVSVQAWCVQRKGPVFVAMFHPVGIVISSLIGVIFLGDGFYLGSLLGSAIVVIGFYTVMWGKSKEEKIVAVNDEIGRLLQDVNTSSSP